MKQLIVNADDFGLTPGINRGVEEAHQNGILTSASLMANGMAFEDAVAGAGANPDLGVGVHLCLTGGHPVLPPNRVRSLLHGENRFIPTLNAFLKKLFFHSLNLKEIEEELRAQIHPVVEAGIIPTHLDSHKHVHAHPQIFRVVAGLAREFGIRCVRKPFEEFRLLSLLRRSKNIGNHTGFKRALINSALRGFEPSWEKIARKCFLQTPDHFAGFVRTGEMDERYLSRLIQSLPGGCTEWMTHPGHVDPDLNNVITRLRVERELELRALTHPALPPLLHQENILLINFKSLDPLRASGRWSHATA